MTKDELDRTADELRHEMFAGIQKTLDKHCEPNGPLLCPDEINISMLQTTTPMMPGRSIANVGEVELVFSVKAGELAMTYTVNELRNECRPTKKSPAHHRTLSIQ